MITKMKTRTSEVLFASADEISLGVDPASLAARKLDSDEDIGSPF